MESDSVSSQPAPPPQARLGLAIAALVLGLASIGLSFVLVGGVLGVAGLVVALIHLGRKPVQQRSMAVGGLILSILGMAASVGFGVLYVSVAKSVISSMVNGQSQAWVGVPSPDLSVTTVDGKVFKLSAFKGKRVVLDYWATWCGPCIREIPHFNQLRSEVSDDDLVLVGITNESESILKPFVEKNTIQYPVASADNLPSPYSNVMVIPTTFFIDRNGIIQSVLVGYKDFEELRQHSTGSDYEGEPKSPPAVFRP